jgi:predicted aldo/keto reductase-like oxidoreductase
MERMVLGRTGLEAYRLGFGGIPIQRGLALKYALSVPGILVLAGVERQDLFDENWRLFQDGDSLTEAERSEIAETQQRYEKVFCRRRDYCQPCTEEIPIQWVLGIRSM